MSVEDLDSNHGLASPEQLPDVGPSPAQGELGAIVILTPAQTGKGAGSLSDTEAAAVFSAVAAPWHPSILARLDHLPRYETLESPSSPERGRACIVPGGSAGRLVSGYATQAADAGAILIEAPRDRAEFITALLARYKPRPLPDEPDTNSVVLDFLALGTACWMLQRLAEAMNHADCLDWSLLGREVLSGAVSLEDGDSAGARNRLRAAFECLTQARERFYPVDDYLLDLTLLDTSTPPGALASVLDARVPFTAIATGECIDAMAANDPASLARLLEGVSEGWADVVGGPFRECEEPLLPLESILWQYRRGAESYRSHLDSRSVETLARRRFGLYPMLPQLARRFGLRFAFSFALDEGRFPIPPQSKRLWEAPDGSSLETLTRPPVSADQPIDGFQLPARIARSMKEDHVATIPFVHWPGSTSGWYEDLLRVARYSPVFGRWTTASDFFHLSDRPWDTLRPGLDEYQNPYLAQAICRHDDRPVSRLVRHTQLRGRFDTLVWLDSLAHVLERIARPINATEAVPTNESPDESPFAVLEQALESGQVDEAESAIDVESRARAATLEQMLRAPSDHDRPGYLIFNPNSWSRRTTVTLPEAPLNLPWTGPLRASQLTDQGVMAVVDLPANGYIWIDGEAQSVEFPGYGGPVRADGHTYQNGRIEVEFDPATGGLRGIRRAGDPTPRMAQQLVALGAVGPDGAEIASRMIGEGHEIEYGGPALAQGVTRGRLVRGDASGPTLARFEQRIHLWHGLNALELEIRLFDIDESLTHPRPGDVSDPWKQAIACRWAWADSDAELKRSSLLGLEKTAGPALDSSEAIEVASRGQRTLLLCDGLAYHRRHGPRMLDTLLIPLGERERSFRLRVALEPESHAAAILEQRQPPVVLHTVSGCPAAGAAGWFYRVDQRGVAITRVQFDELTNDGRGWGIVLHLIETANRATRCSLRLFRDPLAARLTDFQGDHIVDLSVDGDAVLVDLTPREIARVEVTLGEHRTS